MTNLFKRAGFATYIIVVFLNAFVDLGHKIVIQNTLFKVYEGPEQVVLTAIVNGLILLPFILLFTPSGFLADRFAKPRVLRMSAGFAVLVTLGITISYYLGLFWIAFAFTFLLAVQSAIYSPAKYGYIKELVGNEQLTQGNGFVQATTTVAILGGTFLFSLGFESLLGDGTYHDAGLLIQQVAPIGWLLVLLSLLELYLAYRLPLKTAGDKSAQFKWSRYVRAQYLKENLSVAWDRKVIRLSIIGLSVFWAISQVLLAIFPAHIKATLDINNTVVLQGTLACAGIGIVIGSLLAGRLSRGRIETALIPVGALGIATCLMFVPSLSMIQAHALNFFFLGFFGGLFLVPLNALIQFNAGERTLGRVLAANNFIQNVAMLSFLVLTALISIMHLSTLAMMVGLALIAIVGTGYTLYQLPQSFLRFVVNWLFSLRYRLSVIGLDNLPATGGVLLLGNHISWIDWALVQLASPRPIRFVMERSIYERWYLKWLLDGFGVIPISAGKSKQALQEVNALLNMGQVVCLFPEGAISRNGQLGDFKKGFERAAEGADAVITPFYIRGLWGSWFSRADGKLRRSDKTFSSRKVVVAFGTRMPIDATAEQVKQSVFELSVTSWQKYVETLPTIQEVWLAQMKTNPSTLAITDSTGVRLNRRRALAATLAFTNKIKQLVKEKSLGLLLPASNAGAIANLASLCAGKTVVNINYTSYPQAIQYGLRNADIKHVITSRKFVAKLEKRDIDIENLLGGVSVLYMEDIKQELGETSMLFWFCVSSLMPAWLIRGLFFRGRDPLGTAAILFSSGSEGQPKGVELSHRNILANVRQISDVLNVQDDDVILGNLPLFHAFGLTVTTLLPMLEGIPLVCHPDPTDTLGSAKAIAQHRVTILCGTSTFLRFYIKNKRVYPLMLNSLRIVVAGAERLKPEVREEFQAKFNKTVLEGYGATETTPVASVNLPDVLETQSWTVQQGNKVGTVGMPLPGSSFRIVDPDTLEILPAGEDGLILIGGVQVMKGYLGDPDRTEDSIVELDGKRWYKTGDKGHLDTDGFLTIVDRYSRFAKLGGEMVSLTQVEQQIRLLFDKENHEADVLATTIPDEKKGEKVVVLIAGLDSIDWVRQALIEAKCNPLTIPSDYILIDKIPMLGSGKTDFKEGKNIALAQLTQASL